jgi:acetyl-CoA acetyltransferase
MRAVTAIVGAGSTGVGRFEDKTPLSLASEAVSAALTDCGLARHEIDGLIVHIGAPRGADYDETASQLGLHVRFASQTWSHGRFAATVIQHAGRIMGTS